MQKRSLIPFLLALLSLPLLSPPLLAADPAQTPATTVESTTPESVSQEGRKSSPSLRQWVKWLPPTLPPHEVEWLRDNSVFSLYFPQQLAQGKGSVLLIPAAGQHAAWPDHIRALSEQLPPNGWSVLIVTPIANLLPPSEQPPAEQPAADTPSAAQAEPTPAAETPPAAAPTTPPEPAVTAAPAGNAEMIEVLHAGIALLESKGQKNTIVIGMGESGMVAVELAHKDMGTKGSVKGVVLADLPALARPAQKLSEIFRLHPILVLDITHPEGRDAQRMRASQLKQFPQYYAVRLPAPMADIQQSNDRFARRVRGWLTRYVSGEQKSGPKPATSTAPAGKP